MAAFMTSAAWRISDRGLDAIETRSSGASSMGATSAAALREPRGTTFDSGNETFGIGARNADDKVVQHNGIGTVTIDGCSVQTFGKLYRSCGNCSGNGKVRIVVVKNVKACGGSVLAGLKSKYGDTATIESSTCATNIKQICSQYTGNNHGAGPPLISSGPSSYCKSTSITAC